MENRKVRFSHTFRATILMLVSIPSWAVVIDGREWLQPADYPVRSWHEVDAQCPAPSRVCNDGPIVGISGYTWANRAEVRMLYARFGAPPPDAIEALSAWAPAILNVFDSTLRLPQYSELFIWYPDELDENLAYAGLLTNGTDDVSDVFSEFPEEKEGIPSNPPAVAGHFYRPATQPSFATNSAEVKCGNIHSDSRDVVDGNQELAACSAFGDTVSAFVDLPNAAVKVKASTAVSADVAATGSSVDLITITQGFDDNGSASGTFDLEVEGMIDNSNLENASEVGFYVTVWYPDGPAPLCLNDWGDCLYGPGDGMLDTAAVTFRLVSSRLIGNVFTGLGGTAEALRHSADDLRGTLSVPWTVTQGKPSFYVVTYGIARQFYREQGRSDFSASARLTGPDGLQYSGKNGLGSQLPGAQPADSSVDLSGRVQLGDGTDLCGMVLASGQFMFTCDPNGAYALAGLPREQDGSVIRQVYVDGTFPSVERVRGTAKAETVVLRRSGSCPNYNPPSNPDMITGSAGEQISIAGRILLQDTDIPVCALVLANGSHMFSCDGSGSYALDFPLDANGQYKLQVYADGFAPIIQIFDMNSTGGDVRMALASECQ